MADFISVSCVSVFSFISESPAMAMDLNKLSLTNLAVKEKRVFMRCDFNVPQVKKNAPNCTALHCTALHCTALHYITLHSTTLYCTVLHCTVNALLYTDCSEQD